MPTVIKLRRASTGPHLSFKATTGSDCKPCQTARTQELAAAEQTVSAGPARKVTWSGPIIFEGQLTGDGRYIQPNALTWDTLPIPVRYVESDTGEHNGAVAVGRVLSITRKPGGVIWGEGDFDTSEISCEAARKVGEEVQNGVSADLDNVSFTVKVAKELLADPDGESGVPGGVPPDEQEEDADGRVTVLDIDADAEVMDIDDARIRAVTIVGIPAFEGARITIDDSDTDRDDDSDPDSEDVTEPADQEHDEDLVAAAAPNRPPADWFADPKLTVPTPLTITDDGRIFGHLAAFDSCHQSFQQECVQPPRSAAAYAYFRTGAVLTAEGSEIPVGHITLDTFHAGKRLSAVDTIAHYEHTGAGVADVAAGEDEHGIWVAGAIRPNLTDDQLRTLRSSPLSGDWRRIGGNLELVAALAVNVPGFPVPRVQGLVASSGAVQTLVASGVVERPAEPDDRPGQTINIHIHNPTDAKQAARRIEELLGRRERMADGTKYLRRIAQQDRPRLRAASLYRKVKAAQMAERVKALR